MDQEANRHLMHEIANMPELHKVAFICQIFGMFEVAVSENRNVSPEQLYSMAAEFVDERSKYWQEKSS